MVDSDSDLRHAAGLSMLALRPARFDETTMQIPILPGLGAEAMPWVEPRTVGPNGPVWDATDEMFIVYDKEVNRVSVTTGEHDVWNRERAYQRTGSARYEVLRSLSGAAGRVGDMGRRLADAGTGAASRAWRERPAWAGGTRGQYPTIQPDHTGDDAGTRPRRRARSHRGDDGESVARTHGHPRHRTDVRRVSERSDWDDARTVELRGLPADLESQLKRVRSHRHCSGCTGHHWVKRSWWAGSLRLGVAILLGWFGVGLSGVGESIGIGFWNYLILVSFAVMGIALGRDTLHERKVN